MKKNKEWQKTHHQAPRRICCEGGRWLRKTPAQGVLLRSVGSSKDWRISQNSNPWAPSPQQPPGGEAERTDSGGRLARAATRCQCTGSEVWNSDLYARLLLRGSGRSHGQLLSHLADASLGTLSS